MGVGRRLKLAGQLTPRFSANRYVPHIPHPPQQGFLLLSWIPEVFYGGAAGGGKSDAGLMAAMQYVDVPGYSALILRRTFADLALPGAIMDRANTWLRPTDARKHDEGRRWEFPTNGEPATLQFGYAQTHKDIYRYQGAEFQFVFMDELTHFEERTYRYIFSRLRGPALPCANCRHGTSQPAGKTRSHDEDHDWCECGHEHEPREACEGMAEWGGLCGCIDYRPTGCDCVAPEADRTGLIAAEDGTTLADVPLRMRSGSNPGGVGHEWVKARFVSPESRRRSAVFVPAKLRDNPSLDRKAYRAGLGELDEIERKRLEEGDWEVGEEGTLFKRSWFKIADEAPVSCRWVRFWDMAATAPRTKKKQDDPDWTVGVKVGLDDDGRWWVADVVRLRDVPLEVENTIKATAQMDGRRVWVRMEQEPGSSGVTVIDHYRRTVLPGFDFDGLKPQLSKEERAGPVSRAAKAGNVSLISAPWMSRFIDELCAFPNPDIHDDQVDAVSGAVECLTTRPRARIIA